MFREKTGAFRKVIGKHAELVFITAPHEVKPINADESNEVGKMLVLIECLKPICFVHLPLVFYNIYYCNFLEQDQRGWWFSRENDYFKADDVSDCDKGKKFILQLLSFYIPLEIYTVIEFLLIFGYFIFVKCLQM